MFLIKTRVGPSSIHGMGVLALESVAKGSAIWRFHPPFDQVLSPDEMAKLPEAAKQYLETYAYPCSDLDGHWVLSGDHARFLNHSDDPNTEEQAFVSFARRDIACGEEITCDYGAFCKDWDGLVNEVQSNTLHRAQTSSRWPHDNLYTRLKQSRHGIGVFAIRDILAGFRLFEGEPPGITRVPKAVVESLPELEVRRMYFDFCPTEANCFVAPVDFNQLTMAWYMNHSPDPNVLSSDDLKFVTARSIGAGEELTTDYTAFSDHAAPHAAKWETSQAN